MSSAAMLPSLGSAYWALEDLLQDAKDNPINAGEVPGNMFLPAVAVYKELYENISVKTSEAFEKKMKSTDDAEGI